MDGLLEKINRSCLRILLPDSEEEVYASIVNEAVKLVNADFGSIYLLQNGGLEKVYTSNASLYKVQARRRGFTYQASRSRKVIIVDVDKVNRIHPQIKRMDIKSIIFIPLSYGRKPMGVLSLDSQKSSFFTERELGILKLFGSISSLAIHKIRLYDETKNTLHSRDLFISMASHELRTPLTTINGYIELLRSRLAKTDLKTESKWAEELSWETARLTKLSKELLQVNQISRGSLQYDWKQCSLRVILSRAFLDFRFTHPGRSIVFQDQLEGSDDNIVADLDKMIQVVINLLDNAAKYSPLDSRITVLLKGVKNNFVLQVRNDGKGISKEDLPKIFDGFFRAENREVGGGMGLGLFLAKNIVMRHHGTIKARSKANKGTTIEIKLPKTKI